MRYKKLLTAIAVGAYLTLLGITIWAWKMSLEDIYYVSQIVSSIIVVTGLVISVLQYLDTTFTNKDIREREKKVKAAEMANEFQKNLIPLINIISKAYSNSKLNETILEKIKSFNLLMFNREEMLSIFTEKEIIEAITALQVSYLVSNYKPIKESDSKSRGEKIEYSPKDKVEAVDIFNKSVTELANSIEYFSINFNSGIADEDTVYQSLHGIFFKCVEMLYIFMFYSNERESDRLFSNTSKLYVKWKGKHDRLAEEEQKELNMMKNKVKEKIVVEAKK